MGFLDKLKKATNFITGGSAQISVAVPSEVELGTNFPISIECIAKADLKPSRIYVRIESVEEVDVVASELERNEDGELERDNNRIHKESVIFTSETNVSQSVDLKEGETYNWEVEISIPERENPSYRGRFAKHEWRLQVGLDVPGNDPDSGWIYFEAA